MVHDFAADLKQEWRLSLFQGDFESSAQRLAGNYGDVSDTEPSKLSVDRAVFHKTAMRAPWSEIAPAPAALVLSFSHVEQLAARREPISDGRRERIGYSRATLTSTYRTYQVRPREREPLLRWMVEALEESGCRILHVPEPDRAPFRFTLETHMGERIGVVAYAFLANSKLTKNRPADEHRFQIKYGPDDKELHRIWQDPFELYTTLFLGINLEDGFFVGADPVVHDPTRFFISLEFKEQHAQAIREKGWHSWERVKRDRRHNEYPVEVLVGGMKKNFLRFIRFERLANGLDAGHRQLLAEKVGGGSTPVVPALAAGVRTALRGAIPHAVAEEFQLRHDEILDLIASAPRLKMAVRGWVAEVHLQRLLQRVDGVEECIRIEEEGGADIRLRYRGSRPLEIECKNALRQRLSNGTIRLDFQRTRAAKADPCSRFYSAEEFDLVAACLHSCTEAWEFRYALTRDLDPHRSCPGKLDHGVRLDRRWTEDVKRALRVAADSA